MPRTRLTTPWNPASRASGPLWIAFILGRRAANHRYTYGYGRAEDLAGLFIVAVVALSAVVAAWWVIAAGLIGFAGNEAVAVYRIRGVGRSAPPPWWPTACTPGSTDSPPSPSFWALRGTPGLVGVQRLQLRWVGHRLQGTATVVALDAPLSSVEKSLEDARHRLGHALPKLDDMVIQASAARR